MGTVTLAPGLAGGWPEGLGEIAVLVAPPPVVTGVETTGVDLTGVEAAGVEAAGVEAAGVETAGGELGATDSVLVHTASVQGAVEVTTAVVCQRGSTAFSSCFMLVA